MHQLAPMKYLLCQIDPNSFNMHLDSSSVEKSIPLPYRVGSMTIGAFLIQFNYIYLLINL